MNLIEKVFGTHSERELKLIRPIVDKILGMREQMVALSDDELRDNTRKFKERLANGETLDDLLPEAFATVREAARRVLNMEHYPVQLIGGIVLHQGRIAEMRTGEGKTLVSTAPAYLCAGWKGRIYRYRQRLPGKTRCRVDGRGSQIPRSDCRRGFKFNEFRRAPGSLQL